LSGHAPPRFQIPIAGCGSVSSVRNCAIQIEKQAGAQRRFLSSVYYFFEYVQYFLENIFHKAKNLSIFIFSRMSNSIFFFSRGQKPV